MEEIKSSNTIEDWLNTLDEPYRTQAIENTKELEGTGRLYETADNMLDALMMAFVWAESPEEHKYWANKLKALKSK